MKIYAIYCVITVDQVRKENLIISNKEKEIVLPIFEIKHPRSLHNEINYNLQQLFKKNAYNPEILKNINFTYMDLQNKFIYQYLEEKQMNELFNLEEDIFILCCSILENTYLLDSYHWEKFNFIKSFTNMDSISSIVDFCVEKSIL